MSQSEVTFCDCCGNLVDDVEPSLTLSGSLTVDEENEPVDFELEDLCCKCADVINQTITEICNQRSGANE